ncbi:unnamed protein product [Clonostachys byssicola]|uniref:Glucose-methanol-choline oxidoreductase N-terminal domain-containing protein n=1 Tax=Clonostachys byssicola TaxID=160290 RepID=A0A9N9UZ47_9HYPO|nr:unnamed protein product [Clonostachys byssicola]
MSAETHDVVIVGGGVSGLVLAYRLSEDLNMQVVVLECGQDCREDTNTLTPGAWPLLTNSPSDRTFQTVPQKEITRQITVRQGKALGISSAINSFLFTSTSKTTVDDPLPGGLGWLNITPGSIDPRTKQRSYAANAYLDPIRSRPNLTVRPETTVTKVLLEKPSGGGKAVAKGVEIIAHDDSLQTVEVRKEVIISAGAINSPRLLELSGVVGSELLRCLGVDVIVDNPFVGENLQNHLFTGLVFEVQDVDTIDAFFRQQPDAVGAALQDFGTKGIGPLSTSNMITMAQIPLPEVNTKDGRKELDQMFSTFAYLAAQKEFLHPILTDSSEALGNYVFGLAYAPFDAPDPSYRAPGKYVSVAIELLHPLSRGSVHMTSPDGAKYAKTS